MTRSLLKASLSPQPRFFHRDICYLPIVLFGEKNKRKTANVEHTSLYVQKSAPPPTRPTRESAPLAARPCCPFGTQANTLGHRTSPDPAESTRNGQLTQRIVEFELCSIYGAPLAKVEAEIQL
jgi:hypothetical protein